MVGALLITLGDACESPRPRRPRQGSNLGEGNAYYFTIDAKRGGPMRTLFSILGSLAAAV